MLHIDCKIYDDRKKSIQLLFAKGNSIIIKAVENTLNRIAVHACTILLTVLPVTCKLLVNK